MTVASDPRVADPRTDETAGGSRYLARVAVHLGPESTIVERQLPFLFLYLVAAVTLWLPEIEIRSGVEIWVSAILAVVVAVLARLVPWSRLPEAAADLLPVIQLVSIGFLRAATGGTQSIYTSMIFLPVIALASQRGRRGIVIVAVGVAGVITVPVFVDPDIPFTGLIAVRGGFVALVAVVVAVTVHEITERLRARTAVVSALREREQALLERSRADTIELARVADARRATRDGLISIIDSVTEQAIIATDPDGRIEVFNAGAERLLGYAQGEVVGHLRISDLDAAYRDSPLARRPREILSSLVGTADRADPASRDRVLHRRDGSAVTAHFAVTERIEVDGTLGGYVVVATDVTAEREASRLKDEFVSLVSHELRTPLTSVLGYLELLMDGTDELTDEQREYLTVIERNARRQLRLVGDLLLTAQVDAGTFSIAPQQVDVADVVRASVASLGPSAEQAGVRLVTRTAPAHVAADAVRLGQAVDNLVSNAVKFTPSGGEVHVEVGPTDDGGARLTVRDTGIGIAPDELTRLATRFFRATSATRKAIPGVGLGLAITRAVVDAHGGELDVASTLGEGTSFTITLPATPPDRRL